PVATTAEPTDTPIAPSSSPGILKPSGSTPSADNLPTNTPQTSDTTRTVQSVSCSLDRLNRPRPSTRMPSGPRPTTAPAPAHAATRTAALIAQAHQTAAMSSPLHLD